MLFMVGGTTVSKQSTSITNSTLTNIADVYSNLITIHIQLKKVSYYIWGGSVKYQQTFVKTVEADLFPSLNKMSNYYKFTGNETNLISSCSSSNNTVCSLVSSVRIIEGEVEAIVKEIVQVRYLEEKSNVTTHLYDVY